MLPEPTITVLGPDPAHRRCVLNGNAFQQDVIVSFHGWQYAAFYSFLDKNTPEPLYVHLARRQLPHGKWDVLVFTDYPQTVDDGHNTVQMGICPGDGTIHLSYDHHCDVLRYRHSIPNLALTPESFTWTPSHFTPTLDHLPGISSSHSPFQYLTYPRFVSLPPFSLLFTHRDGKAGLGNDHLYRYDSLLSRYTVIGAYLVGISSNPYIHGLSVSQISQYSRSQDFRGQSSQVQIPSSSSEDTSRIRRIHTTWVYRSFVPYPGWDDPLDTQHKQQAGPNGAENNHDICYSYSDDGGVTWFNSEGKKIGYMNITRANPEVKAVSNDSEGIVVFEIPPGRGLTNQESQTVDFSGGVHVLNRDDMGMDEGEVWWKHYYRNVDGKWTQHPIRPVNGGKRGRLAVSKDNDLYILLPDSQEPVIRILKAKPTDNYSTYEQVWEGNRLTGEPLVDSARLEHDNVLSVFIRRDVTPREREVVVLNFQLDSP